MKIFTKEMSWFEPGWGMGLVIATALVSCTPQPSNSDITPTDRSSERPKVVATTTILCDFTRAIATEGIDLTCLLFPGQDVHGYQPLPADRRAIEDAQLILYSGYNFEGKLTQLIQANTRPIPKIAVAEQAVPTPLWGDAHDHTHGEGDDHATEDEDHDHQEQDDPVAEPKTAPQGTNVPDPHVWQNAQNGAQMVNVIAAALTELVPTQSSLYQDRANQLVQQIEQTHLWIQTQIATIPESQRKLVTTHDAFGYYATAYDIPLETALQGVSTAEQPSAARIQALVETIKATQVPTIFVEVGNQSSLLQTVAQDASVTLAPQSLFSDGLGEPGSGAETYLKMLQFNTQAIVEGLGGKFEPMQATQ